MNKETTQERADRKATYIARVISMGKGMTNEKELRKEAEAKFEEANE